MAVRKRKHFWSLVVAAVLSFMLSSGLVYGSSSAAFTATTSNPANQWNTGYVRLTDDDGGTDGATGTALFSVGNMRPGQQVQRCITVTTTMSNPQTLRMYATGLSSTKALDTKLDVNIARGTGGSFERCTGFVRVATIYDAPLSDMVGNTNWLTGFGTHAVYPNTTSTTYRINITLNSTTTAAYENASASFTFAWTAQNR